MTAKTTRPTNAEPSQAQPSGSFLSEYVERFEKTGRGTILSKGFTRITGSYEDREHIDPRERVYACYDETLRQGDMVAILRIALMAWFNENRPKDEKGEDLANIFDPQLEHLEKSLDTLTYELDCIVGALSNSERG